MHIEVGDACGELSHASLSAFVPVFKGQTPFHPPLGTPVYSFFRTQPSLFSVRLGYPFIVLLFSCKRSPGRVGWPKHTGATPLACDGMLV